MRGGWNPRPSTPGWRRGLLPPNYLSCIHNAKNMASLLISLIAMSCQARTTGQAMDGFRQPLDGAWALLERDCVGTGISKGTAQRALSGCPKTYELQLDVRLLWIPLKPRSEEHTSE